MRKRILSLVLVVSMLMVIVPVTVSAATSGSCGTNVTWTLDDSGTLTISGTGAMKNYYLSSPFDNNNNIKSIIIEDGVTSIDFCF